MKIWKVVIGALLLQACSMKHLPIQLTHSAGGHTLHHQGVFSGNGKFIVFDGRNEDTKIGETTEIGVFDVKSGVEKIIYKTQHASQFGPGVGAASFHPIEEKVIFIQGLEDANESKPYAITRRTGVGVSIANPDIPVNYDARDITVPYTPGSLRGGTHAHAWSGDGHFVSFTYNDEWVDAELRVVGVMFPKSVQVDSSQGNNSGTYYSAIISNVVRNPKPGSDEINKAFDECWIGNSGYFNQYGKHIPYAIAFQGNTLNHEGKVITEVFIAEIDQSLILDDSTAIGQLGERPKVPKGIVQRRITFTENGLSDTRHWLRSSPDGKYIYALAKDTFERNQIVSIETNTGDLQYITHNPHSISFSFNLDKKGEKIAYIAANKLYLFDLKKGKEEAIFEGTTPIVGAPSFAPNGDYLIFNQYIQHPNKENYLQIMRINLK